MPISRGFELYVANSGRRLNSWAMTSGQSIVIEHRQGRLGATAIMVFWGVAPAAKALMVFIVEQKDLRDSGVPDVIAASLPRLQQHALAQIMRAERNWGRPPSERATTSPPPRSQPRRF